MQDTEFERRGLSFIRGLRRPKRPSPIFVELCLQCGGTGRILDWRCQECIDRDENEISLYLVVLVDILIVYVLWLFLMLRVY